MTPEQLLDFLHTLERLKCNTRHAWTSTGRHETVAAHSWRLAVLAMLVAEEVEGIDRDKLIRMCLIHDFGEAVTGDIPSFSKTASDERREAEAIDGLLTTLPPATRAPLAALFAEMDARQTPEARLFGALDKLEAVIQHNESPLSTWLPLEYDLQRTYGEAEAAAFPYLQALRAQVLRDTIEKIDTED